MQKKDYKMILMNELVKNRSLREAVKWLDTSLGRIGKTPAQLIKEGNAEKALKFFKKQSK